ncbi:MAG: ABC transporter permease [Clostridiales bacterium]|nr:ABC transporter permease [Clostridiales bacterium]
MNSTTKKRILARVYSMSTIIIVALVFLVFTIATAAKGIRFLKPSNLSTILNQASFLVVLGIGQALVILTGGIDLSVGALMAFVTVFWGEFLLKGSETHFMVSVVGVLLTGAAIGLLNGLLITKLRIPPFIVTFATMYACRGLGWVYLRNRVLYPLDETFRVIATGKLFKIDKFLVKTPVLIAVVLLFAAWFVLRKTNVGRKIYFTGANPTAARFSGINTDRVKIGVYVASSVLAAFAGLMYVARLNACEPGLGHDSNFDAITVALIGGFAMSGGYGNIWGVLGGALVAYTIQSGMNSLQMPSELQDLISGCLIIFAVFINQLLANRRMELENDIHDAKAERTVTKS